MQDLRYPIGRFQHDGPVTAADVENWIGQIAALPHLLRRAVAPLDDHRLDTPYRPGGWTIRQVVHHVPDSHLNSYVRFKWALTEDEPTIKAYDEAAWAELADYGTVAVGTSLDFLGTLHAKWVGLLETLSPGQLSKTFRHPDSGVVDLGTTIGAYAWHGRHHLAHITSTIERNGW